MEDTKPEKLTKEEKELHKFHRQRLRKEIYQSDPYALGEVKILEYLLTLATARGDTNPLAHELLNKFGNISNVVNANCFALAIITSLLSSI